MKEYARKKIRQLYGKKAKEVRQKTSQQAVAIYHGTVGVIIIQICCVNIEAIKTLD